MAKLSQDEKRELNRLFASGTRTMKSLGKQFGVTRQAVSQIVDPTSRVAAKKAIAEQTADSVSFVGASNLTGFPVDTIRRFVARNDVTLVTIITTKRGASSPRLPLSIIPFLMEEIPSRENKRSIRALVASLVSSGSGCHEWTGKLTREGYGLLPLLASERYAHRFVFADTHGPIPAGLYVCHKCDNPACVRVDHLFLGTAKENTQDSISKGRFGGLKSARAQRRYSPETVTAIRAARRDGFSWTVLAAEFGGTWQTARRAALGETYRDIPSLAARAGKQEVQK